jgi:diadenosine tetraphosphatase ApaH/serine/threonine PP2A family protein phosphatase
VRGHLVDLLTPDPDGRAIWNADSRASGVYFVQYLSGGRLLTRRIVLAR